MAFQALVSCYLLITFSALAYPHPPHLSLTYPEDSCPLSLLPPKGSACQDCVGPSCTHTSGTLGLHILLP